MLKTAGWLTGLVILPLALFALLTTLTLLAQAQEKAAGNGNSDDGSGQPAHHPGRHRVHA